LNQAFPTCAVIGPQSRPDVLSSIQAAKITLTQDQKLWLNLQQEFVGTQHSSCARVNCATLG
jgi:hypothetical protein